MVRKICIICDKPKTQKQSGANPIELGYTEVHFDCWHNEDKKTKSLREKAIEHYQSKVQERENN